MSLGAFALFAIVIYFLREIFGDENARRKNEEDFGSGCSGGCLKGILGFLAFLFLLKILL